MTEDGTARTSISVDRLSLRVFHTFDTRWLLLAVGDFSSSDFNVMTISWGSLGVVWGKPFAQVFVRPSRYTWQFMERAESFTLSVFPEKYREGLAYCGSHSGRAGDKTVAARFTPIASRCVSAPGFDEAELIIECKRMYFSDLDPAHFLDPSVQSNYPSDDYHRAFFGEIAAISGISMYEAHDQEKGAREQANGS